MEGATLAVSVLGAAVVEALGDGVAGADAIEGSGLGVGAGGELELAVDGVLNGAGAGAGVERGAGATLGRVALGGAGATVATFGRSAAALGFGALPRVSAGLVGSLALVGAASAGTEGVAAAPASVLVGAVAVFTAGWGSSISASLYLWLKNSAPPITDAVMTPNAIPKWFTGSS